VPRPGEAGFDTWGDVPYAGRWHVGTWMVPSFDPALNLVYVGTSVTSPAPKFALGGNDHDYLYNNSTLALDGDTGRLVWHFQHVVDHWDMDHTFERLLLDTRVAPDAGAVRWINPALKRGEQRAVLTGIPGKSGIVYARDRRTGEFLWATETVQQNLVQDIDVRTGRATVNPEAMFSAIGQTRLICPGTQGGKDWMAGAYSPLTHAMYFPLQNVCTQMTAVIDKPSLQSLYGTRPRATLVEGEPNLGTVRAVSAVSGVTQWTYRQRAGTLSLVATAGGLLFGGDSAGAFRALDQNTGKVLWEVNLGAPVTGYPITFESGGRQYVVATTGTSISTTSWNTLTPEVNTGATNMIYVFVLE
jgi:glucose dehydrogenase